MEERIRALIARIDAELTADEVAWAGPASAEAIARIESALGVRFPASFRTLLLLTGGGGVKSFPISSIDSADPVAVQYGTVYGDTLHIREPWWSPLPSHMAVVQRDADDNEPFCLDTSNWSGEECPVVLYYLNSGRAEQISRTSWRSMSATWPRSSRPQQSLTTLVNSAYPGFSRPRLAAPRSLLAFRNFIMFLGLAKQCFNSRIIATEFNEVFDGKSKSVPRIASIA
jgi:SMI1-KNR4 cell-wall